MIISVVAAMDRNRLIGAGNRLPWHLPADLKRFKSLTMGKPILMGRKTYESIGRCLPGRTNIVVTSDMNYQAKGCHVVPTLATALVEANETDELLVVGGARIYEQMLPATQRLYMTLIDSVFEGDAYFPMIDTHQWRSVAQEQHDADEENPYPYSFINYERV